MTNFNSWNERQNGTGGHCQYKPIYYQETRKKEKFHVARGCIARPASLLHCMSFVKEHSVHYLLSTVYSGDGFKKCFLYYMIENNLNNISFKYNLKVLYLRYLFFKS